MEKQGLEESWGGGETTTRKSLSLAPEVGKGKATEYRNRRGREGLELGSCTQRAPHCPPQASSRGWRLSSYSGHSTEAHGRECVTGSMGSSHHC